MSIPFVVLPSGSVSTESDPDVQLAARVGALVGTEIGQRPMHAQLGLPLAQMLFGIADNLVVAELRDNVTHLLDSYEPGLRVLSVSPKTQNSKDGIAELEVDYTPILKASDIRAVADTVNISVGGTVTEVTLQGNAI